MSKKTKPIVVFAGIALVSAALAGGATWWLLPRPAAGHGAVKKVEEPRKPSKYVTLDKVIVMLRRAPGEAEPHYLSTDLVLATSDDKEKPLKEQLPLLRSIAVRALSRYTMSEAAAMSVEQYADLLNKSFNASYAQERLDKPFTEVMIGKLITE
jgi:flagellar FliL protein